MENEHVLSQRSPGTLSFNVHASDDGIEVVYIRVREGQSVKTEQFDENGDIILDLDAAGDLLGIEILAFEPNLGGYLREIAEQFDVPALSQKFHPEYLPSTFA